MDKYTIGSRSKFSFGNFITDIQNSNFKINMLHEGEVCENCGQIVSSFLKEYKIKKLLVIDNGDYYVGYSDKGHTLRLTKEQLEDCGVI